MAAYTQITLSDVNEFLSSYHVGECLSFNALAEGSTNSNYRIKTQHNDYILTLFEEVNDVGFLVQLHTDLSLKTILSAKLIKPKTSGLMIKNKPALLFEWIHGISVNKADTQHCQLIGHHLAVLHRVDYQFPAELADAKDLVWSMNAARDLLNDNISDEDADIITEELNYFRKHSRLSLPSGLIHADCFRNNVLFSEQNNELNLLAMIDFENATRGAFMFDLAIVINDWCSNADGSLDRLKMRDVIAAYSKVRTLESIENQSIPFMLRAAAFRFWVSRLSDKTKKSPDEFKYILLNRRLSLSGMQHH